MKKTDRILQYLDGIDGPLPGAADIAAAIDDADGIDRTKALLTYLAGHGKVEKITDGRDVAWRITEAGREALAEATEDAPSAPAKKVVHRAPPPARSEEARAQVAACGCSFAAGGDRRVDAARADHRPGNRRA